MANTYIAIATTTVGSGGAASIDFTSIPQTYTDLCILVSARTNRASVSDVLFLQCNSDSNSANYSSKSLFGTGSSAGSAIPSSSTKGVSISYLNGDTSVASSFANILIYIPNYTSSNYKSLSSDSVMEDNVTLAYSALRAGLWSSSSAISSITLQPSIGPNFTQYTTATLYGIKKD